VVAKSGTKQSLESFGCQNWQPPGMGITFAHVSMHRNDVRCLKEAQIKAIYTAHDTFIINKTLPSIDMRVFKADLKQHIANYAMNKANSMQILPAVLVGVMT